MTRWEWGSEGKEVVEAFKDRVEGKTILITGPSQGGIGAETAISLAAGSPFLLLLTGRNLPKIEPVIKEISSKYPNVKVEFVQLDLSSQKSVREGVKHIEDLLGKDGNIDILINNAAIMACPYEKSADGIESQFATNHIGGFLLTNLLRERLKGKGTRVVNVSSTAHRWSGVRFEDVNFQDRKAYNAWDAYGQSKTANILFAAALAKRMAPYGGFAFSLHPGSITSNLQIHLREDPSLLEDGLSRLEAMEREAGREFKRDPQKTLQQGCSTTLVAALDPEIQEKSGAYLVNGNIFEEKELPRHAVGLENEEKLWTVSGGLVGERFEW